MEIDDNGDTAAHRALRNGDAILALNLIRSIPRVAEQVNIWSESLMYLACWNGYTDVFWELLENPRSARDAPGGRSILMAAILSGRREIAQELLQIGIRDDDLFEALFCAIRNNQLKIVKMLLSEHNRLGLRMYNGESAFSCAAKEGNVSIGKMIIRHFSFAAALLFDNTGRSALHIAVEEGHIEFVTFILREHRVSPYPWVNLINQTDELRQTPLHLAAMHCRPRIVEALLADKRQHFPLNNDNFTSLDVAYHVGHQRMSGFKWSEVVTLLSDASCPVTVGYTVRERAKQNFIDYMREHANSVTRAYRQSTSIVGILITTVTFATAFTLPGGYISYKGPIEGIDVLAREDAFQVFLILDILAMCASLIAAFICNMYRLSDLDFVLYYAKKIGYLMWFSYSTMAVAFASGLCTVLAHPDLWQSTFIIVVLSGFIPHFTYQFVEWPVLKLDHQLRVLRINTKEL